LLNIRYKKNLIKYILGPKPFVKGSLKPKKAMELFQSFAILSYIMYTLKYNKTKEQVYGTSEIA